MTVMQLTGATWTRKHDLPGSPLFPSVKIYYPTSLKGLFEMCKLRPPGERLKAGAGGIPLPSQIRRFVRYDLPDGLVKSFSDVAGGLLVPDDGLPVLICKNLDPNVNPFAGAKNPYDFTFDRRTLREPTKGRR